MLFGNVILAVGRLVNTSNFVLQVKGQVYAFRNAPILRLLAEF